MSFGLARPIDVAALKADQGHFSVSEYNQETGFIQSADRSPPRSRGIVP
jgi:hypothetical protein